PAKSISLITVSLLGRYALPFFVCARHNPAGQAGHLLLRGQLVAGSGPRILRVWRQKWWKFTQGLYLPGLGAAFSRRETAFKSAVNPSLEAPLATSCRQRF